MGARGWSPNTFSPACDWQLSPKHYGIAPHIHTQKRDGHKKRGEDEGSGMAAPGAAAGMLVGALSRMNCSGDASLMLAAFRGKRVLSITSAARNLPQTPSDV